MAELLDKAAATLVSRSAGTGVKMPASWREELGELARRLTEPGRSALSPCDACPDNNVRSDSGVLSLVDFEGAAFSHVAWDVAYLTVPWPSCWCSWRIPGHLSCQAVNRYCAIRPGRPGTVSGGPWKDRALNAEDALKAAYAEISSQRDQIGKLLGRIRDLEIDLPANAVERISPPAISSSPSGSRPPARTTASSTPASPASKPSSPNPSSPANVRSRPDQR